MLPALFCFPFGLASLVNVSEKFEPLFLLGSAAMGATALVPAYRKKHGRISCLALFGSGILCLLLRHYIGWRTSLVNPSPSPGCGSDHRRPRAEPQVLQALPLLRFFVRKASGEGSSDI